jgi:hypothetical protein
MGDRTPGARRRTHARRASRPPQAIPQLAALGPPDAPAPGTTYKELFMKTIALWTALVMAASTAAYASPTGRVADRNDAPRTNDHDHDGAVAHEHYDRYDRSRSGRDFHGRWVPLAQIASGRGERQFGPSINNNRFRKIRVEAVRGEPMILKVTIQFTNDSVQMLDVNTNLRSGAGEVIDLNGDVRQIRRVIVYSDPQTRGSYTVYGA